ncbi:MAG: hypothetical protein J6X33_04770 [Clostridiales bacterium]|nr:hypothetical protein [Clostridiales bacterium]
MKTMKTIAMILLVLAEIAGLILLFTDYMRFGMFIIAISTLSVSIASIYLQKNGKENV